MGNPFFFSVFLNKVDVPIQNCIVYIRNRISYTGHTIVLAALVVCQNTIEYKVKTIWDSL